MDFRRESPRQTLDYYALCVSGVMHKPLDLGQRAAIVAHLEKVLPPLALKELRSDWAMKLALAVTQEVLSNPRFFAPAPRPATQLTPTPPLSCGPARTNDFPPPILVKMRKLTLADHPSTIIGRYCWQRTARVRRRARTAFAGAVFLTRCILRNFGDE